MIAPPEVTLRLLTGALLGGAIGWERQVHGRPAGLRTHLLVCLASSLLMIVSEYYHLLAAQDPSYIRVDPARLAAGAITGVGFIGAGVILKAGMNIHGLTTAASIWVVAAIGLAAGGGLYYPAFGTFLIAYFALWALRELERRVTTWQGYRFVTVVTGMELTPAAIRDAVARVGVAVERLDAERDLVEGRTTYDMVLSYKGKEPTETVLSELAALPGVNRVAVSGPDFR